MAGVDLAQKVRPRCWGESLLRSEGLSATVPTFHHTVVTLVLWQRSWEQGLLQPIPQPLGAPLLPCLTSPYPASSPVSQGDQQERSLEHLCLSDRSSLLSEIQALRAQLRMTHLQNQEKLQQLCTALTSAEARGSRQEHRLRRQGGCGRDTHLSGGAGRAASPSSPQAAKCMVCEPLWSLPMHLWAEFVSVLHLCS